MSSISTIRRALALVAGPIVLSVAVGAGAPASAEPSSPPRPQSTHRPQLAEKIARLASDSVHRIHGSDRIGTAIDASQSLFDSASTGEGAKAVVIARFDAFPDALAGVPLAAAAGGPLLITPPNELNSRVAAELDRVLDKDDPVYLLGDTGALSQAVEDAVRALGFFNVTRLQGPSRFETALEIAKETERVLGANPAAVLIATGRNFPDALGAGAAAGAVGGVVVLSNDAALTQPVADYVSQKQAAGAFVATIGGPAIPSYPNADAKIAGGSRYQTAALVADFFFVDDAGAGPPVAGLATGLNFPDALSGGAFMGLVGGPMLLTTPSTLHADARAFLSAHSFTVDDAFIFGGGDVVSHIVDGQVAAAIAD